MADETEAYAGVKRFYSGFCKKYGLPYSEPSEKEVLELHEKLQGIIENAEKSSQKGVSDESSFVYACTGLAVVLKQLAGKLEQDALKELLDSSLADAGGMEVAGDACVSLKAFLPMALSRIAQKYSELELE